jgi:hypothetical protein
MQIKDSLSQLSQLRVNLQTLLKELRLTLKVVFGRTPLVKGNIYELARKCGKPHCTCTRGELHRTMVLTWSENGKTRIRSIPRERVLELKAKSEAYLRFRRARARVTEICRQIIAVLDQMERLRREEP